MRGSIGSFPRAGNDLCKGVANPFFLFRFIWKENKQGSIGSFLLAENDLCKGLQTPFSLLDLSRKETPSRSQTLQVKAFTAVGRTKFCHYLYGRTESHIYPVDEYGILGWHKQGSIGSAERPLRGVANPFFFLDLSRKKKASLNFILSSG